MIDRNSILYQYFEEIILSWEMVVQKIHQENKKDSELLNNYFRKIIDEAWL